MKQFLTGIGLVAVLFILPACKKNKNSSTHIIGTWELRVEVNGFSGHATNYEAGNGRLLNFSQTTYAKYENGQQIKNGVYQIVKDSFMVRHTVGDRIIFDNQTSTLRSFIQIDDNKLKIEFDGYDTPSYTYEKMPSLQN